MISLPGVAPPGMAEIHLTKHFYFHELNHDIEWLDWLTRRSFKGAKDLKDAHHKTMDELEKHNIRCQLKGILYIDLFARCQQIQTPVVLAEKTNRK